MKQKYVYSCDLLETGDIVFYRPMRGTRIPGSLCEKIKSYICRSPYVYVGMIQKTDEEYNVIGTNGIEELKVVLLSRNVDVYRIVRDINTRLEYNKNIHRIMSSAYRFDANFVIMKICELVTKPSHWTDALIFWSRRLLGFGNFSNDHQILKVVNCASVLEYAMNEIGFDLCKRVSPNYATLDTMSRSALIDYLFTIERNASQD